MARNKHYLEEDTVLEKVNYDRDLLVEIIFATNHHLEIVSPLPKEVDTEIKNIRMRLRGSRDELFDRDEVRLTLAKVEAEDEIGFQLRRGENLDPLKVTWDQGNNDGPPTFIGTLRTREKHLDDLTKIENLPDEMKEILVAELL